MTSKLVLRDSGTVSFGKTETPIENGYRCMKVTIEDHLYKKDVFYIQTPKLHISVTGDCEEVVVNDSIFTVVGRCDSIDIKDKCTAKIYGDVYGTLNSHKGDVSVNGHVSKLVMGDGRLNTGGTCNKRLTQINRFNNYNLLTIYQRGAWFNLSRGRF